MIVLLNTKRIFSKKYLGDFFENLPSIVFATPSVPLTGDRNPQGREDVTALLGAWNRYALRLAGHQSPRQIVRDGTAWGKVGDRLGIALQ